VVGIPNGSVLGGISLPQRFTNLTLTDVQAGGIASTPNFFAYLTLVRSDVGNIYLDGGWSGGSSVTLADSSAGNIYVSSTYSTDSITLTNSTAANLEVRSNYGLSSGVTLTNSSAWNIIYYAYQGNNGVTLYNSTAGDIAISAYDYVSGSVYLQGTSSAGTITGDNLLWINGSLMTGWGPDLAWWIGWPVYLINGVQHSGLNQDGNGVGSDGYKYINATRVVYAYSLPAANQVLSGVAYGEGLTGTHTEATIPNAPQAWGNYTYYAQGDVVSEGGFLWLLANTGGWTVGGRPSLGYGWQKLSTGGGASAPQPINLAQLVGLPPFIQL
jgi:hypothetical protein